MTNVRQFILVKGQPTTLTEYHTLECWDWAHSGTCDTRSPINSFRLRPQTGIVYSGIALKWPFWFSTKGVFCWGSEPVIIGCRNRPKKWSQTFFSNFQFPNYLGVFLWVGRNFSVFSKMLPGLPLMVVPGIENFDFLWRGRRAAASGCCLGPQTSSSSASDAGCKTKPAHSWQLEKNIKR